jgi:hypothetical protein
LRLASRFAEAVGLERAPRELRRCRSSVFKSGWVADDLLRGS